MTKNSVNHQVKELDKKIFTDELDSGFENSRYVTVKDFVNVMGKKKLPGLRGRAIGCPTVVTYRNHYAGTVYYSMESRNFESRDTCMLVEVTDILLG